MQPMQFEIPEQMRDAADKSVTQARQALEQFLDATQKAMAQAEGSAKTLSEGAADLSRQSLAFVEDHVAASFDLAHRLVQARTVEEMVALQQEYLRKQMESVAEQGKALGEMASRTAGQATKKTGR